MKNRRLALVLLVAVIGISHPSAQTVPQMTRGPYLQRGTSDSIVVRWRTNVATDSRVLFGAQPGNLAATVGDSALTTDHEVTIDNLLPDTRYHYAVGTSTDVLAGDDADHFFTTAPLPGSSRPIRVWAVGDSGTADQNARAVKDAYITFAGERHTDLWLMLGDNAYPSGTDAEYQAAVFNMYPELLAQAVVWPTFGNHDAASANSATQSGPYYEIFTLPGAAEAGGFPSGTEAYYSFDYGNVHFVVLDSYGSSRLPAGPMLTWLAADLASTAQDWVVAYWHHPPYSKGSHDSDNLNGNEWQLQEMRENALPILEDAGVDLVLSGHSHSYERSFLLDGAYATPTPDATTLRNDGRILNSGNGRIDGDGAYRKTTLGPGAHEGAVYVVAGSSGQVIPTSLGHPVMYLSLLELGSLVLDIDANFLTVSFLDTSSSVADSFTLVKPSCDADGLCEFGEDCAVCPSDCATGVGASCGNGICEAGDGEDCLSCPADCAGRQKGNPANRFCCGDGDGENPLPCGDSACTKSGSLCFATPVLPSCCGDDQCDLEESSCDCAVDCGPPHIAERPATCQDGVDNDCDGFADCADGDCASGLLPPDAPCASNDECCSGRCRKRRGTGTCQ